MRFVAGAATDVGRVRDDNEDAYLVDKRLSLFAVADGMGGHRAGEVASAAALEALRASIASGDSIADAIRNANAAVLEKASDDSELMGMGTTLTAVVPGSEHGVVIGHVGDSRAYIVHDGELEQLTDDHSLVEELVREGRLTHEQAEVHPQRSIITRALGIDAALEVDLVELPVQTGDRILLCSDGLTIMVRPAEIASILRREAHPAQAAERLIDAANEAGGDDNVTAVVLDVVDVEPTSEAEGAVAAEAATAVLDEAPDIDEHPSTAPAPSEPEPRAPAGRRRRALKMALIALPVLVILVIAFVAVGWYARRTYFVTFRDDQVTLFKGVPGGLLGWDPTLELTIDLTRDQLTPAERTPFEDERRFGSRSEAVTFLGEVADEVEAREREKGRNQREPREGGATTTTVAS